MAEWTVNPATGKRRRHKKLSPKQKACLERLFHRYRRQIAANGPRPFRDTGVLRHSIPAPQPLPLYPVSVSWEDVPRDIAVDLESIRETMERNILGSFGVPAHLFSPGQPDPPAPKEDLSLDALRDLCKDAGEDGGVRFSSEGGFRINPSEN